MRGACACGAPPRAVVGTDRDTHRTLPEREEYARSEERFVACLALCEETGDLNVGVDAQLALGSLRTATGDVEGGQASLLAARDAATSSGFASTEVLSFCELALLEGGVVQDAVAAYTEHEERLSAAERREARYLLFRATGVRLHLEVAKNLLDEALAKVPEQVRESMCRNKRVNRQILAAWHDEFGGE